MRKLGGCLLMMTFPNSRGLVTLGLTVQTRILVLNCFLNFEGLCNFNELNELIISIPKDESMVAYVALANGAIASKELLWPSRPKHHVSWSSFITFLLSAYFWGANDIPCL